MCPGIGLDEAYVEEIVAELKRRQTKRGDAGNIARLEANSKRIALLESKLDALLDKLNIDPQVMSR